MNNRIFTILLNGSIILVLCLLLFFIGTWWRLNSQFALGEEAYNKGDFSGAVAGYESALHLYIPYNKKIDRASEKLWSIGEANEKLGDINRSLIAYRALRSSFYADHWFVTPGKEWIKRCDAKIAALVPLQKER